MTNQEAKPHGRAAKIIHWGFIAVFIYALTKQLDEVEELEDFSLLQYEMAFATFFLILLLARFFYMRSTHRTALPDATPRNVRLMVRSVHLGMYAGLALVAITGLLIGAMYWSGIKTGNAMELALLIHEIGVNTSYFLIIGHVAASIYHRRKADGIWDSMVPFWRESKHEN